MKKIWALLLAALLLLTAGFTAGDASTAETGTVTVYKNGTVYTANANREYATAFAVQDGKFIYVGDDAGAAAYEENAAEVIDLQGATVIPGLIEGHTHFAFMAAMNSLGYQEIPSGIETKEEALEELKNFVAAHPDYEQYVIGNFPQTLDMDASDLDTICADKPVACVGMGLHCLYVNSKFMEVGHIDKNTEDAIPGETYYIRDAEGNPTGKIVELPQTWDAFQRAIKPDNEKLAEEYLKLQELYHSYGFIGMADGGFLGLDEENMLKVITGIEAEGKLKMVVATSSIWYGHSVTPIEEIRERAVSNKEKYTTALVHPGTVKMWADGTIGAYSALMREPYADKDTCGATLSALDDLIACAEMCRDNDLNIHYHAIGDKAIENVLTAYETVGETTGTKSIVHFEIAPDDLVERASKIEGLIINMTPSWATVFVKEEVEPLGERRDYNSHAKECMDAGITVNFGADSNGEPKYWNPAFIMSVAMVRNPETEGYTLKGKPCTFEDAVDAYSINVAKERRLEGEYGSIETGKYANFVIWDAELMNSLVSGGETEVLKAYALEDTTLAKEVYFMGEQVYSCAE